MRGAKSNCQIIIIFLKSFSYAKNLIIGNVEDGFTIITPAQDKVLVCNGPHDNGIQVTNDGATILKSIGVDNPAAKVLVGQSSEGNSLYRQ